MKKRTKIIVRKRNALLQKAADMERKNMARGQRRSVEEKISEKEEAVRALRARLKAEQSELDALLREKREKDLEGLNQMLTSSGLDLNQAADILKDYIETHISQQSA